MICILHLCMRQAKYSISYHSMLPWTCPRCGKNFKTWCSFLSHHCTVRNIQEWSNFRHKSSCWLDQGAKTPFLLPPGCPVHSFQLALETGLQQSLRITSPQVQCDKLLSSQVENKSLTTEPQDVWAQTLKFIIYGDCTSNRPATWNESFYHPALRKIIINVNTVISPQSGQNPWSNTWSKCMYSPACHYNKMRLSFKGGRLKILK